MFLEGNGGGLLRIVAGTRRLTGQLEQMGWWEAELVARVEEESGSMLARLEAQE